MLLKTHQNLISALHRRPAAVAQTARHFSVCEERYPNEPEAPTCPVTFPGPKSKAYVKELSTMTCTLTNMFPIDTSESLGNYVADVDGNKYLDMFCAIASIGLGYNHPVMLEKTKDIAVQHQMVTRAGIGVHPEKNYIDVCKRAFIDVAPKGLNKVITQMCGSCANEAAFKYAFMCYEANKRGGLSFEPSQEDLDSCACNIGPGSPNLGILSFKSGFHGRLFASLSTTRTKAMFKLHLPAFDWPAAEPPRYKYPLDDNQEYNEAQDDDSIADVRHLIAQWKAEKGCEVAAVLIEPVMSEGGDNYISPAYGQKLRNLTKELGIYMIVDEVQTGVCVSGDFWAHDHWNLDSPPDFVTFAKKMLSCGFFHSEETTMITPYRHFNTFMGDPLRAHMTAEQNKVIKEDDLCNQARVSGDYLLDQMFELQSTHPYALSNSRGLGTIQAFDCEDVPKRDALIKQLKLHGVHVGPTGIHSIRYRPSLYFEKKHVDLLINQLDLAIKATYDIQTSTPRANPRLAF